MALSAQRVLYRALFRTCSNYGMICQMVSSPSWLVADELKALALPSGILPSPSNQATAMDLTTIKMDVSVARKLLRHAYNSKHSDVVEINDSHESRLAKGFLVLRRLKSRIDYLSQSLPNYSATSKTPQASLISQSSQPSDSEISNQYSTHSIVTTNYITVSTQSRLFRVIPLSRVDTINRMYFFTYQISITNTHPTDTVQLLHRTWYISDNNQTQVYSGVGVVGKQPILPPNGTFSYESSVHIMSIRGQMSGKFSFVRLNLNGPSTKVEPSDKTPAPLPSEFECEIGAFLLEGNQYFQKDIGAGGSNKT